jgi:hypothetical protein
MGPRRTNRSLESPMLAGIGGLDRGAFRPNRALVNPGAQNPNLLRGQPVALLRHDESGTMPETSWIIRLSGLWPGMMSWPRSPPARAICLLSQRNSASCRCEPWQPRQFSFRIGWTSRAKSTVPVAAGGKSAAKTEALKKAMSAQEINFLGQTAFGISKSKTIATIWTI